MAFERKKFREIVDDILTQITKGVVREKHLAQPNKVKYKLRYVPLKEIVKVEGVYNGETVVFEKDLDYVQDGNFLYWLDGGRKPDENTFFYVNYIYGEPTGLTDINPGSVLRTIVEAISREIEYLYTQMEYVYKSGFIDTATGTSLDFVVSLLGITRKQAECARGIVTFGRSTPPPTVTISGEAHMFDGSLVYTLKNAPISEVIKVYGKVNGQDYDFEKEVDYSFDENSLIWLAEGKKPDMNTVFFVDYASFEKIVIPKGVIVSTFARSSKEAKTYVTVKEGVLERKEDGRWEADVEVVATVRGREGNTYAGSITVMPRPPPGVEYVINRKDITGGTDVESDEELRERAKKALMVAGKATLISLETAVKGVEGVSSILVEDMPDEVPGLVRIIVDGGDMDEIKKAVEEVRAAGIKVELMRPKPVYVDVEAHIIAEADVEAVQKCVENALMQYLGSLNIGEDLVYTKAISKVLTCPYVYDVSRLVFSVVREESHPVETFEKSNVKIESYEKVVPRKINVLVKKINEKSK
ncbi:MAG: hypothetical protein B6U95_03005 [Thermofilum sp. ex4484_82]|nr:MAG: hypothetical protein B6U95_03005 [Thermofilum sp. ex4484_82]OYT39007.1 MAG: hypothetical protein B6U96_03000 [Archaeoglobales archaeon ex4484_92]